MIGSRLFLDNKYSKWYWAIIDRAKDRDRPAKTERHHILPKGKHLFPEFASLQIFPWNGAYLTFREHFICHRLLVKMTSGKAKISCSYGLRRLTMNQKGYTSKQYEIAKQIYAEQRKFTPSPLKGQPGRKWSDEERKTHSVRLKSRMSDPITRQRCSLAKLGKGHAHTDETKQKISQAQRNLTDEQRARKSASKTGNKNPAFGKKWFNDGTVAKQFFPGQEPFGWKLGKRLQTGPSKWARKDWELEQEKNLCYVATTRAIEELILCQAETK